jgi:hypothetical protein
MLQTTLATKIVHRIVNEGSQGESTKNKGKFTRDAQKSKD